jgi:hypothetical protein
MKKFFFLISLVSSLYADKIPDKLSMSVIDTLKNRDINIYHNEVFPSYDEYKKRFYAYKDDNETQKFYMQSLNKSKSSWSILLEKLTNNNIDFSNVKFLKRNEEDTFLTKEVSTRKYSETIVITHDKDLFYIRLHECFDVLSLEKGYKLQCVGEVSFDRFVQNMHIDMAKIQKNKK